MIEFRKPHIKIKIITIGAPRVLNKALCSWYNSHLSKNTWRIINHFDPINQLPISGPIFQYDHVESIIIYIKKNSLLSNIPNQRTIIERIRSITSGFQNHGISEYIENLNKFDFLKYTEIC